MENSTETSATTQTSNIDGTGSGNAVELIEQIAPIADLYAAYSDRALIILLLDKVSKFEQIVDEALDAAQSNPMARMMLGKLFK